MIYEVTITFGGLPAISLDGKITRGTTPDTWRIRIPHDSALTAAAGELRFVSDSGAVTLRKCIPDLSTLRTEHHDGKREWSLLLRDRRATWPGKQISGRYNKRYRDNTRDGNTELNAQYIAALALGEAGESGLGASLPTTYPDIDWDRTPVNKAIDELLSLLPGHVCRDKDDAYSIKTTGQGDGIDTGWPAIIPDYLARVESGPKTIRIRCGKTWYGCRLELEAVGIEDNGKYLPIDQLSYRPAYGWENEWPTLFSGVAPGPNRQRAFESVFRCYQVKANQTFPFSTGNAYLQDLDDLDLYPDRLIFQKVEPPPAYVTGTYYPYGDHPYNTANCPNVACDFVFDKANRLIKFEYPIFKMASCIAPAVLQLHTAFHLRDNATHEWNREVVEVERNSGEGEWELEVPHLWRAMALGYSNCSVSGEGDNRATVRAEAQVYADAWKDHFDEIRDRRHVSIAGIHPIGLNGKLAQVRYRVGRGMTPVTKCSMNFEATT
jgi:hypothetical protein